MKENGKYSRPLNVPKAVDDEIMFRLKEAKATYRKSSKNGVVVDLIEQGLPLLQTLGDFAIHRKVEGVDYVRINLSISLEQREYNYVKALKDKFGAEITMILYSALLKGIGQNG